MRNINLIIRQTYFEKYGIRTIGATLVITLGAMGGILWHNEVLSSQLSNENTKASLVDARVSALTIEKQKDARTIAYESLSSQVQGLKQSQIDWVPFFRELVERLPQVSRINRAQAVQPGAEPGQTLVSLSVDLKDWFALKEYIRILKNHPMVVEVKLKGMNRESMIDPTFAISTNPLAESIQSSASIPIPSNQVIQPPLTNGSMDPFLEQLNQYLAPGSESSIGSNGVDEGMVSSGASSSGLQNDGIDGTPFSADDLSQAQQIIQQMDAAANQSVLPNNISPDLTEEESEVQATEFLRCQLDITIRLQSSPKG